MQNRQSILLIEDERVITRFLTTILAEEYTVLTAETGREGLSLAASHTPELVLLDLGLPDVDGMEVLRALREWSDMPVIVVSARQNEEEKVQALDSGANDYVTKPFGNQELLARIRAALRLYTAQKEGAERLSASFRTGALKVDFVRRMVMLGEQPVHLTPMEYRILVLLAKNAGKVLTHDYMIREIWGPYAGDSQILRVNMANIRRKIEPDPADPVYILTEVGVGYRLKEGI